MYGFLHDMLDVAGGDDVFADEKRESVQASSETLLARRAGGDHRAARRGRRPQSTSAAWQALPAVPAVRDNRIVVLTGTDLVTAGPRVAAGTRRLAKALHPEAFK